MISDLKEMSEISWYFVGHYNYTATKNYVRNDK